MNKTLSIIGIILFGLAIYDCITTLTLVVPLLEDAETIANLASLLELDEGSGLSSQTDTLYGSLGYYFLVSIFGLIISIVSFFKCRKNPSITDMSNQLRDLGQLRDKGILSEDEFGAKKREIMMKSN